MSDAFGSPMAGPSTEILETIDEDEGDDQAAAGPMTQAKGKEKAKETPAPKPCHQQRLSIDPPNISDIRPEIPLA